MKKTFGWVAAFRLLAAFLCLPLTGCQTHPTTKLGGGFEEITHPTHNFIPGETKSPRISLNYVTSNGAEPSKTVTVWPSLYCPNTVEHEDWALFVGERAFLNAGTPELFPRLFAVQSAGIPVDITGEVLRRWAGANGKDVSKTFSRFSLILPEEKNGNLTIHLEFWSGSYLADEDWPQTGELTLSWSEATNLIHSVEMKGFETKDVRWHTPFIEERF